MGITYQDIISKHPAIGLDHPSPPLLDQVPVAIRAVIFVLLTVRSELRLLRWRCTCLGYHSIDNGYLLFGPPLEEDSQRKLQ